MSGNPLVIAFADFKYLPVLEAWHRQVKKLGIQRIRIFALDNKTANWCAKWGIDARRIHWNGQLDDLWVQRVGVFKSLVSTEAEFIHSDVDAIWVKNPLHHGSATQLNDDLVFSQGTTWPEDVHAEWGFVLCCGWFWARSSPASRAFFDLLQTEVLWCGDDQLSINRILASADTQWAQSPYDSYTMADFGKAMTCWKHPIRARTPAGLTVALLPHREFQRMPEDTELAVVKHYRAPKVGTDKLKMLSKYGLLGD